MEWIISIVITLLIIFNAVCMINHIENCGYNFRCLNIFEKIARIIAYLIVGIMVTAAFACLVWLVHFVIYV